ncbi:hypothetical protein BD410DRAFT_719432, partial [Rickenella mellea]
IKALPPILSYSPIHIPITTVQTRESTADTNGGNTPTVTIIKRDLYDARFQLISQTGSLESDREGISKDGEGVGVAGDALEFIDNPSDLVPGVYEGGLKTWECSLDLVDYLEGSIKPIRRDKEWIRGKRILEIGCGTAIPSLYLLQELFASMPGGEGGEHAETVLHFQDYNRAVLELVTFPNVLLTWYMSPLGKAYHELSTTDGSSDGLPRNGELHVSSDLIASFLASLCEHNVTIRFSSGSWDGFPVILQTEQLDMKPYDFVLTSETIYRLESLPSLITLLRLVSSGREHNPAHRSQFDDSDTIQSLASKLKIDSTSLDEPPQSTRDSCLCLIAAKILYFGVGGGVAEFERMVQQTNGIVERVVDKKSGVGRTVLNVRWPV